MRRFLRNICGIQWSCNLPEVPSRLLAQQLQMAIDHAHADVESPGAFDKDVRADAYDAATPGASRSSCCGCP